MKTLSLSLNLALVGAVQLNSGSAINKVVKVLEDMKSTLETETAAAEKSHEKFGCWCNKIDALSEEIAAAQGKIDHAQAQIEQFTAKSAQLTTELEHLDTQLKDAEAEIISTTTIRGNEKKEFEEQEKSFVQGISSLGDAIAVLSKHNSLASVKSILKTVTVSSPTLTKFLQAPGLTTDAYENQTGGVFGVLTQMKEEFEQNLEQAQADEAKAVDAFNMWLEGKKEEVATIKEGITTSQESLAKSEETVARFMKVLASQKKLLGANTQALVDGQRACKDEEAVFGEERKARAEEAESLSEALKVLSSDSMFAAKTSAGAFLQTRSKYVSKRRVAAIKALRAAGTPKAFFLSTKVGEDVYAEIRKAAEGMITNLKEYKANNQESKDSCVAQIQESESRIKDTAQEIERKETDKDQMETDIAQLTKDIEETDAQQKEMITTLNDKSEQREEENKEFQQFVAEQQNFAKLINQAKGKLEKYYKKKAAAAQAFVQKSPADQAAEGVAGDVGPMPEQKRYKAKDGNVVIQMLDKFIADSETSVNVGNEEESASQGAYEEWVKGANNAITSFKLDIANSQKERSGVKKAHGETTKDLGMLQKTATEFAASDKERRDSCDFILTNFDANQSKAQSEIDSIENALGMLSGMRPAESFLQRK